MLSLDDIRELMPLARSEAVRRYPSDAAKALVFFCAAVGLMETRPTDDDVAWAAQTFIGNDHEKVR